MRRLILTICGVCFLLFQSAGQDLTGIWRGQFKSGNLSGLMDSLLSDRYKFETQLVQKNNRLEGVTYSYKSTIFYGKASCLGTVSPKTKKVIIGEDKLLEVQSESGGACLMTCFLQYSKMGDEEFLEGSYTAIDMRDSSRCGGGTVFLRKVSQSDFYTEPFLVKALEEKSKKTKPTPPVAAKPAAPKKPAVPQQPASPKNPVKQIPGNDVAKKTPPPSIPPPTNHRPHTDTLRTIPAPRARIAVPQVIASRKNELIQTIVTSSRTVDIRLYDNGTVDNDTVSVYLDNQLVVARQRLTESAIPIKITLNERADFHELIMVAENLGEIPPNTSLMVVTAGDQRYEVRITSNEQKNAVVRFRYEP